MRLTLAIVVILSAALVLCVLTDGFHILEWEKNASSNPASTLTEPDPSIPSAANLKVIVCGPHGQLSNFIATIRDLKSNKTLKLEGNSLSLPSTDYELKIRATGYYSHTQIVSLRENMTVRVELREIRRPVNDGKSCVVDADTQEPIVGAEIEIVVYSTDGDKTHSQAVSGNDGTFALPQIGLGQEYRVTIQHEDYVTISGDSKGDVKGVFELAKAARIVGYAWGQNREPLPLGKVSFKNIDIDFYRMSLDGNKFEISQLPQGDYTVYVQPLDYYRLARKVSLSKREAKTINVTFDYGSVVTGTVHDLQDQPIEGVLVSSNSQNYDLSLTSCTGAFRFNWPADSMVKLEPWSIDFMKSGYKYTWVVEWIKGSSTEVRVVMGNQTATIHGTVIASGVPFEGTLYIEWRLSETSTRPFAEVVKGKFRMQGILPGKHNATFQAEGYLPIIVSILAPKKNPGKVDLVFTNRGGTVTGRVFDPNGIPIDASISCWSSEGTAHYPFSASTNNTGEYTISGLDGIYYLMALPKDSQLLKESETISVQVSSGKVEHVDLFLQDKN